ncbi:MAG: DUF5058 family protein [Lachnospiraceae bacterium]|nr:DUF5058 family protein [Lachnospiraceae bacterium]MBO4558907.1 DUF5058 family protein [Lachnospiraceae bacterium]MBR5733510.1 DUF5058 family protein [Lachnospiraceae bacterium]
MELLAKLNGAFMYLICGAIILLVAVICVIFAVRAYKAGKAMGIDTGKMKRVITASATFSILPGIGILLGVIALSGSLGTPWPWLRLSVIGALHYETQVAEAAAEAVGGGGLSASTMTGEGFTTIALLMCFCIIWGMVLMIFNGKSYVTRLMAGGSEKKKDGEGKKKSTAGFGDVAMTAMFIGLVSAYIASYVGTIVSSEGVLTFKGSWLSLAVAAVAALAMAAFLYIKNKAKADWIDSFSVAGSMLIAMASAILLGGLV